MLNFMDPEKQTRSWKVRSIQGAHDIWQWFQAVYQAVNNSDFDIFVCLCWRIWTSRNKMFMAAQLLIHMIRLPLSLNIYSSSSWLERDYQGPPDRNAAIWTPPTGNLVKLDMSLEECDREYLKAFEELDCAGHDFFSTRTGVEYHLVGKKVLGRARNQGLCSSCVACVVCDNIAAMLALSEPDVTKRILEFFSPQHIVDCMPNDRKATDVCGCKLTTFKEVYKFLKDGHGVVEEVIYKYVGQKEQCGDPSCTGHKGKGAKMSTNERKLPRRSGPDISRKCKRVNVSGFTPHDVHNFNDMKEYIRNLGPVGASIRATEEFEEFDDRNGKTIFDQKTIEKEKEEISVGGAKSKTSKKDRKHAHVPQVSVEPIFHAVLIIGYGTDPISKKNFYIIKNSCGIKFGYLGYAKVVVDNFEKDGFSPKEISLTT